MRKRAWSVQRAAWSWRKAILCMMCLMVLSVMVSGGVYGADKWPGVDETVVERVAKEHGREAREPFINTDQGDLLLFVFLLAGSVGGFLAGYYWRILITERSGIRSRSQEAGFCTYED